MRAFHVTLLMLGHVVATVAPEGTHKNLLLRAWPEVSDHAFYYPFSSTPDERCFTVHESGNGIWDFWKEWEPDWPCNHAFGVRKTMEGRSTKTAMTRVFGHAPQWGSTLSASFVNLDMYFCAIADFDIAVEANTHDACTWWVNFGTRDVYDPSPNAGHWQISTMPDWNRIKDYFLPGVYFDDEWSKVNLDTEHCAMVQCHDIVNAADLLMMAMEL